MHSLVGHIPNIDCVICNIVVMILVTMNERQQVLSLKKHCSVDSYFFSPTLKKVVYLSKTGKDKIINFKQVLYYYHFEGHYLFQYRNPSHVEFSTRIIF